MNELKELQKELKNLLDKKKRKKLTYGELMRKDELLDNIYEAEKELKENKTQKLRRFL